MSDINTLIRLHKQGYSFVEISTQAGFTEAQIREAKAILRAKQLSRQRASQQHAQASFAMRLKPY